MSFIDDFNLTEELLRVKESGGESVVEVDAKCSIEDLQALLDESTQNVCKYNIIEDLKSWIINFDQLSSFKQNQLIELFKSLLASFVIQTKNAMEFVDVNTINMLKKQWEITMFLLYWLVLTTERRMTAKASNTTTKRGAKGKKMTKDADETIFDWSCVKLEILDLLDEILSLPLMKMWTMMHERAPFISIFNDIANLMLETESNIKSAGMKKRILSIISSCLTTYGQSEGFHAVVIQNLKYSNHLSDFMVDLVSQSKSNDAMLDGLFKEIGKIEFHADDKTAKQFSQFLTGFCAKCAEQTFKRFSFLTQLVDSESYTIRQAMVDVVSSGLMHLASKASDSEMTQSQSQSFCMILEERTRDISSFVRARVLKSFSLLTEVNLGENLPLKNVIPIKRRQEVTRAAVNRLHDKTVAVRKEAIKFLTKMVQTHPFWLDGGFLDCQNFRKRKEDLESLINKELSKTDFISELVDALPQEARDSMAVDQQPKPVEPKEEPRLSQEELDGLKQQLHYYSDALEFTKLIIEAIEIVSQLLASKAKQDVIESIAFFVECHRHRVSNSDVGVRKMVHLVWSKDTGDNEQRSVREYLTQAFYQLYFQVQAESEKDEARLIVKNLITLTFESNLADLTSIEQLLSLLMSKGMIKDSIIQHLWHVFGSSSEIPSQQRKGAIILLGMLNSKDLLSERLPLLVKIGFGEHGQRDLQLAKYTCIAIMKLDQSQENNHFIFVKLKKFIINPQLLEHPEWFPAAEQAINLIYALAVSPEQLSHWLIRRLTKLFQLEQPHVLPCLLFILGHTAIKQIAHLEVVEKRLKCLVSSTNEPRSDKPKSSNELDQVVGSVEDEIGDWIHQVRQIEILYGQNSLLGHFKDFIVELCSQRRLECDNPLVYRMAVLALCKYMCISERFCHQNLSLLFSILGQSRDSTIRCNIIIGIGDLAVCFNNLIDQNINHLYARLRDSDLEVKKNALMVLTHLILNGMVKVKGQLSEMALCIEDEDLHIADLAQLFFSELATKENAIYNNLTDIISNLSQKNAHLSEIKFNNIMRYLFAFIEKDKQMESIIEKLCGRFKDADNPRLLRDLSFCLSLLQIKSDKSVRKLMELLPLYRDKLYNEQVYSHFVEMVTKAKKFVKTETKIALEDFEAQLERSHRSGKSNADVEENAMVASQSYSKWNELKPTLSVLEETKEALQNLQISETPVKKPQRKKTIAPPKKKTRKRVVSDSDESDAENLSINA